MTDWTHRARCALCRSARLAPVLSLPATPPANEFVAERGVAQDVIPLTVLLCRSCGHAQLSEIVSPSRLFGSYVYVSGTSRSFVEHFERYAIEVARYAAPGELVVEVGSNDGTLLRQFQRLGHRVVGIDPATAIAEAATARGIPTVPAFLTRETAASVVAEHGEAQLVCANNVFAHAEDLAEFTEAVKLLLADDGVFVFEVSYLGDVVRKTLFDTVYHEHSSYHALAPLVPFFDFMGMRLFHAERVNTHGGSIRCYVGGEDRAQTRELLGLRDAERELRLHDPSTFAGLRDRVLKRAAVVRAEVELVKARGGTVAGFGAPAKLTTLMYAFGLTAEMVDFVVDDSTLKHGLFTPGTHIPVWPTRMLYERRPELCIVFAWNFAPQIMQAHKAYEDGGGRFLVPLTEGEAG